MESTVIYTVYTLTPKGGFSQKYEGPSELAALEAYGRLLDKQKPRTFNKIENGLSQCIMRSEDFPQ